FTVYHDYIFPSLTWAHAAALVNRPLHGLFLASKFLEDQFDFNQLRTAMPFFWRYFTDDRKAADHVNRDFLIWLSQRRPPERPFFVFLNYFDAHHPYQLAKTGIHRFGSKPSKDRDTDHVDVWLQFARQSPSAQQLALDRDAYDDCIADLDEQVGILMDELQRRAILDSTCVIVAADHGESFGEHPGVVRHGGSLYQTELHVPLIIIPPKGSPVRQVVTDAVSLRALPATVVNVLNLDAVSPFPGVSLARLWNESSPDAVAQPPGSDPALSEVVPLDPNNPDPTKLLAPRWPVGALSDGAWTYIRREGDAHEELFHVIDDAGEQQNLAD